MTGALIEQLGALGRLATTWQHAAAHVPVAEPAAGLAWAGWILWLPALATALCGVCAIARVRNKLPGWLTTACLGAAFLVTVALFTGYEGPVTIHLFRWFDLSWGDPQDPTRFIANFSLYVDRLTLLWMLFVTGLGTLITLYATEYMEGDVGRGYTRFFAGMSIFLFAMSCLVMGDNLVMLYLGWEGVGFASYYLIGYYYKKPSAVEAAKKAFIMNRIGDLGLALGVYLTWHAFGTVQFTELFTILNEGHAATEAGGWSVTAIPYLFMLGAFGKSAQIPLYVWLPDAMEGPTPVSALIHAATMVTAGVYLVARMYPVFLLEPTSLQVVAWIGGLTALLAATIGMAQYDIKRIMAYSTVSQLGYMFMGLGVLTSFGAAYHVFTHAFFKAVLFLTCGAIMHGFAGQLDLWKVSGLRHMDGWKTTSYTMLYACLCLIGFPFITNGFWSKDMIMAEAFVTAGPGFVWLGVIGIITAFLTAYYAFRVWFRVCAGPQHYEMGDEHHGDDHEEGGHEHAKPHPPRLAINLTLLLITAGAIWSIFLKGWAGEMVTGSTAAGGVPVEHHDPEHAGFWSNPHQWMMLVAGGVGIAGLLVAAWFHLWNRPAADSLRARLLASRATRWLPTAMEHKWYVDEVYHALVRAPLWVFGVILNLFDRFIVDGLIVDGVGRLPRWLGRAFQPLQNGALQSYAATMTLMVGLIVLFVLYILPWLQARGAG
ncbi:MAG: NADH-quinone oxidoreductase subunit L [Planctomycetota bacterium]|jgi:NADH-quinone oxidoreductase subunit L